MTHSELQHHMFTTYITLRISLALLAFGFPILLCLVGFLTDQSFQASMSEYYYSVAPEGWSLRDLFVGILFSIGILLCVHRGYSYRENNALNLAGIFAIVIAICPLKWPCRADVPECSQFVIECVRLTSAHVHKTAAVLFFLSIAYICIWCASDSLCLIRNPAREKRYRTAYHLIGVLLIPIGLALVLGLVLERFSSSVFLLSVEMIGFFVFATYWLVKSREIASTYAEA